MPSSRPARNTAIVYDLNRVNPNVYEVRIRGRGRYLLNSAMTDRFLRAVNETQGPEIVENIVQNIINDSDGVPAEQLLNPTEVFSYTNTTDITTTQGAAGVAAIEDIERAAAQIARESQIAIDEESDLTPEQVARFRAMIRPAIARAPQVPPNFVPEFVSPEEADAPSWTQPYTDTISGRNRLLRESDSVTVTNPDITPKRKEELQKYLSALTLERAVNEELARQNTHTKKSRESSFVQTLMKKKVAAMSLSDLVMSESPLILHDLSGYKAREVLSSGLVDGISMGKKHEIEMRCRKCANPVPYDYAVIVQGRLYCTSHVPNLELCNGCHNLQPDCVSALAYDGRDIHVCANCKSRNTRCGRCSNKIGIEFVESRTCLTCMDRLNDGYPERRFSWRLAWVIGKFGTIIKSKRIFSAEIEAFTDESRMGFLAQHLPKEMGIGSDSSITTDNAAQYPFEIQTPRIGGTKGEELLFRVGTILKGAGAHVNDSCGMHVHLDGKGILPDSRRKYPTSLIQLFKAYLVFEDVIMSLLPYSRRDNDFCRPFSDAFSMLKVEMCNSVLDVEKMWYEERTYDEIQNAKGHHHHSSRYFGVNFHSLLASGHLEIRFHSGTTNPRKILEWANLHLLIMDLAASKQFTPELLRDAQKTKNLKEKTKILFDAIGLSPSSQQYFYGRQKKFSNKKENE